MSEEIPFSVTRRLRNSSSAGNFRKRINPGFMSSDSGAAPSMNTRSTVSTSASHGRGAGDLNGQSAARSSQGWRLLLISLCCLLSIDRCTVNTNPLRFGIRSSSRSFWLKCFDFYRESRFYKDYHANQRKCKRNQGNALKIWQTLQFLDLIGIGSVTQ